MLYDHNRFLPFFEQLSPKLKLWTCITLNSRVIKSRSWKGRLIVPSEQLLTDQMPCTIDGAQKIWRHPCSVQTIYIREHMLMYECPAATLRENRFPYGPVHYFIIRQVIPFERCKRITDLYLVIKLFKSKLSHGSII